MSGRPSRAAAIEANNKISLQSATRNYTKTTKSAANKDCNSSKLQDFFANSASQVNLDEAVSELFGSSRLNISELVVDDPNLTSVDNIMGENDDPKEAGVAKLDDNQLNQIISQVTASVMSSLTSSGALQSSSSSSGQSIASSKSDSALSKKSNPQFDEWDEDEASFKLQAGSERNMIRQHPYLGYLYKIGLCKIEKNLASYDDWSLLRTILIWSSEKPLLEHPKMLEHAAIKLGKDWLSLKPNPNNPSLFIKTINTIDRCYYHGGAITKAEVAGILMEFKDDAISFNSNNHGNRNFNSKSASTGQSGRSSFQTCHHYNDINGCKLTECRYPHSCSHHAKSGIRAKHPVYECEAAKKAGGAV